MLPRVCQEGEFREAQGGLDRPLACLHQFGFGLLEDGAIDDLAVCVAGSHGLVEFAPVSDSGSGMAGDCRAVGTEDTHYLAQRRIADGLCQPCECDSEWSASEGGRDPEVQQG